MRRYLLNKSGQLTVLLVREQIRQNYSWNDIAWFRAVAFQAHPSHRLRGYHDEKATIDTCKRPRRFLPRPGVDRARKSRRIPLSCLGNERFPSTRIRRSIAAAFQRTRFSPGYHDEQRRDDHDGGTRSGVSSWPAHTFVRERKTEKGWREKVAEKRRQRERKI